MTEALAGYESQRDAASIAHYQFTSQFAALEPPPPEMQQLLFACSQNPEAASQLFGVVAQTVSEQEFFHPDNLARIVSASS